MKKWLLISLFAVLGLFSAFAQEHAQEGEDINVTDIIFEHVGDSYEWHIITIGDRHISIPLPCIVYSRQSGWNVFSSERLAHGHSYRGFRIALPGEEYEGKIVEQRADGSLSRPLDLSMTKNVFGLLFNSIILVLIVLCVARWYRKHDVLKDAPTGLAGIMEMMITMVEDDIIKDCVGKDYKRYSPYLLTAFFFIFFSNLLGIVPFFPGGLNITGNIAVTFVLALFTFMMVNLFGNKHYWKEILWPDVPLFLKAFPLMPLIEIIGMFTKPFSLMVRLFANILAGHCMIIGVVSVIFLTAKMGVGMNSGLSVVAIVIGVFMDILELLVAFLQAYVFTMLSSVFIGLSRQEEHGHAEQSQNQTQE